MAGKVTQSWLGKAGDNVRRGAFTFVSWLTAGGTSCVIDMRDVRNMDLQSCGDSPCLRTDAPASPAVSAVSSLAQPGMAASTID